MATTITSDCINCGACEPECPNTAIYSGGVEWELPGVKHPPLARDIFYIVPEKCTECVGFFDHEACAAVCPVDCCVPDPQGPETEEALIARARGLHPDEAFAAGFPSRFRKAGAAGAPPTETSSAPALTVEPVPPSAAARLAAASQVVPPPAAASTPTEPAPTTASAVATAPPAPPPPAMLAAAPPPLEARPSVAAAAPKVRAEQSAPAAKPAPAPVRKP